MIRVNKVPGPEDLVHASAALVEAVAEARRLALSGTTGSDYRNAIRFAEDLLDLLDQGVAGLASPPPGTLSALACYRAQLTELARLGARPDQAV